MAEYVQTLRANADDDARRAREEATAEATETIEEGLHRRGQTDDQIHEREDHHAAVLDELSGLRAELSTTIDAHPPPTVEQRRARPQRARRRACPAELTPVLVAGALTHPRRNGVRSPASAS